MIHAIVTDFKIAVVVIAGLAVLKLIHLGHRRVRRRRRASLTVRETIPVGRSSWITFGKRFRN